MINMDEDNLVRSLTFGGHQFDESWCNFLFNVAQAMALKEKEKTMVLQVLQAGQR